MQVYVLCYSRKCHIKKELFVIRGQDQFNINFNNNSINKTIPKEETQI